MTIEEDFESTREALSLLHESNPPVIHVKFEKALAALDRIEGYVEQCADFQRAAEQERDALRLELDAEKFNHRKDNEYLVQERDALKAALEELVRVMSRSAARAFPSLSSAYEAARETLAKLEA